MTSTAFDQPLTAQRAWGIGAIALSVLALLPTLIVAGLMAGLDGDYGWLVLFTLPVVVAGGAVAMLAGIVGLVYAIIRRRGYLWPAIGCVVGIALIAGISIHLAVSA